MAYDPVAEAAKRISNNVNRGLLTSSATSAHASSAHVGGSPTPSTSPMHSALGPLPSGTVGSPPALGYGGGNYTQMDDAGQKQMDQLDQHLRSDPSFVQSEIQRATDVLNNRKTAVLDYTAQQDYLNRLTGTYSNVANKPTTQPTPSPSNATPYPTSSSNPGSYTSSAPATPVKPATPAIDINGITDRVTANVNNSIQKQIDAYNQQVAQAQQGNQLAVTQNKQFLDEQINKYMQQQNVDQQNAQTLQNRRGGFYSGGLDQQMSDINRTSTEQRGNLTRDVESRNADIWNRNSLLAQQASDNINRLKQATPDVIRQQIQEEIDRQRGFNLQEGSLTGNYGGQRTIAGQQTDNSYNLGVGQLMGQFKGAPTLAGQNQAWQQQMDLAGLTGQYGNNMTFPAMLQLAQLTGQMPGGQSTLAGKQANLDAALKVGNQTGKVLAPTQSWGDLYNQPDAPLNADQQRWQDQFTYGKQLDAAKIQQSAQQFAQQMGLDYAKMNQNQQQFLQDMAYKQSALEQSKSGTNSKELEGLYTGLSSGKIDPASAIDEINMKMKSGMLTATDGTQMLTLVQQFANNKPAAPMQAPSQTQIQQNGGTNPQDLNAKQLEELWKTDPTGKSANRPMIDWSQWYRDPQGRLSGVSYEAWHQAYGPKLKAK